jgi:WD40 repeat protein
MLSSKVRTINLKTISDGVQSVAMDHAGRRIAIGSHTGHVWLLDSDGKTDLRKLGVTEGGSVNAVTFAADDRKVAAGTQDGVMTIWNLMEPSAPALKLRGHAVPFDFLVENKLRQEVISVDMSGLLRRWSMDPAASEPAVLNVTAYQQLLFPPKIHALAFRPRSTEFVVAGDHGLFQLWDMRRLGDPPKVFDLGGPQVHVMAAGFAADGTTLAAATVYGEVKSWRLAGSAVPAGNFRLPTGGVPWVITPVGNSAFAIADNKGSVTLWPGAPDSPWKTMKVHSQNVRSASTATDAMRLFTGSDDGGVNAIELKGEGPFGLSSVKAILPARQNVSVTGLAASPDGHWLAITETTGVRLLELGASGERSIELRDATFSASCVALSPDNKRIAAGGSDGVLRVWSTERPDLKPVLLSGHTAAVRYVAFSPDGHHLVSGSYDSTVRIWAASTEALVRRACGLLFGDGNPLSEPADIDSRWRMACGG